MKANNLINDINKKDWGYLISSYLGYICETVEIYSFDIENKIRQNPMNEKLWEKLILILYDIIENDFIRNTKIEVSADLQKEWELFLSYKNRINEIANLLNANWRKSSERISHIDTHGPEETFTHIIETKYGLSLKNYNSFEYKREIIASEIFQLL